MRLTIRDRLLLAIGLPLVAAYGAMLVGEFLLSERTALANAKLYLTELVARRAAELDRQLAVAEELVSTLAVEAAAWPDLSPQRVRATLQKQLATNPNIYGMCAAFEPDDGGSNLAAYYCREANGSLREVDVAATSPNYRELDWYRPAKLRRRIFWTEPYFDAGIGDRIMCTCTAPIIKDGKFRGVLTADLLTDDLVDELENLAIGEGYCILISSAGAVISHPDRSLVLHETIFTLAQRQDSDDLTHAAEQMIAGKSGAQRLRNVRKEAVQWMVYAPAPTTGWSLAAVIAESEVTAPIHARLVRLAVLPSAALAVLLATVWIASARITRPIGQLAAAAESLGHGDLEARVPESPGSDEIAQLGRRFNAMAADLKANVENRLREEAARRRMEGELRAAREIQTSLLPPLPLPEQQRDYSLHALNLPAKSVAGDFYDFFMIDARRLALVMADVSGKGLPAAMYMAVTRTRLRDFAAADRTPGNVIEAVNRRLSEEDSGGMFVTMFFAYFDLTTGELTYVNAGHNPPYLVRATGQLESLDTTGPLVAAFPDAQFRDERRRLLPGDLLFLFTDGITEAGAGRGELFGEQRLEEILLRCAAQPPADVCQAVIRAVREFGGEDLDDDATLLALRRPSASAHDGRFDDRDPIPEGSVV